MLVDIKGISFYSIGQAAGIHLRTLLMSLVHAYTICSLDEACFFQRSRKHLRFEKEGSRAGCMLLPVGYVRDDVSNR
jgi:hypothetical protein